MLPSGSADLLASKVTVSGALPAVALAVAMASGGEPAGPTAPPPPLAVGEEVVPQPSAAIAQAAAAAARGMGP